MEDIENKSLKTLEAVFFIYGKFLGLEELVNLLNLNPIEIKELILKLKKKYSSQDSALDILEKGGKWKMDIKEEYYELSNRIAGGASEFSSTEKETLAIIAFKQPVKQSVIINIRGNKSYEHIRRFLELNLLERKKMGRTWELSLSQKFYDYFNLSKGEKVFKGEKR